MHEAARLGRPDLLAVLMSAHVEQQRRLQIEEAAWDGRDDVTQGAGLGNRTSAAISSLRSDGTMADDPAPLQGPRPIATALASVASPLVTEPLDRAWTDPLLEQATTDLAHTVLLEAATHAHANTVAWLWAQGADPTVCSTTLSNILQVPSTRPIVFVWCSCVFVSVMPETIMRCCSCAYGVGHRKRCTRVI